MENSADCILQNTFKYWITLWDLKVVLSLYDYVFWEPGITLTKTISAP